MKTKHFGSYAKIEIRICSPTSIAVPETLNKIEYFYDKKEQMIYFPDPEKWSRYLDKKGWLERFINLKVTDDLLGWYQRQSRQNYVNVERDLGPIIKDKVPLHKGESGNVNTIARQVRLPDGRAYLPGSSIKGLIRTAIIYSLLMKEENKSVREKWRQEVKRIKEQDYRRLRRSFASLSNRFENDEGWHAGGEFGSLKEIMHGIQCSDAVPKHRVQTEIFKQYGFKVNTTDPNGVNNYREMILKGSVFSGTLTVDPKYTGVIGINTADDVIRCLYNYYDRVTAVLKAYYENYHQELFANCTAANGFLGNATGFLHKTIFLALFSDEKDTSLWPAIRNLMNAQFPKHHHLNSRGISPKLVKAVREQSGYVMPGEVEIRIVG